MKSCLMFLLSVLCTTVVLSGSAVAEVQPVTILIGRGTGAPEGAPSSYTVPTGKVLIVEAVEYIPGNVPTDLIVQFLITPINFGTRRPVYANVGPYERLKLYSFASPVRVSAGDGLGSNATTGFYIWHGLLADVGDLFASLDVELSNPRVQGGKLVADSKVSSPRPRRMTVQSATDLVNAPAFQPDPTATITPGTSRRDDTIAVDAGGKNHQFVKATAVARPKS